MVLAGEIWGASHIAMTEEMRGKERGCGWAAGQLGIFHPIQSRYCIAARSYEFSPTHTHLTGLFPFSLHDMRRGPIRGKLGKLTTVTSPLIFDQT